MDAYGHLCYQAPPEPLQPLSASRLLDLARAAKPTAAGLDGWAPLDFALLPHVVSSGSRNSTGSSSGGGPGPRSSSRLVQSSLRSRRSRALRNHQLQGAAHPGASLPLLGACEAL